MPKTALPDPDPAEQVDQRQLAIDAVHELWKTRLDTTHAGEVVDVVMAVFGLAGLPAKEE
jgi:hypothetical protein